MYTGNLCVISDLDIETDIKFQKLDALIIPYNACTKISMKLFITTTCHLCELGDETGKHAIYETAQHLLCTSNIVRSLENKPNTTLKGIYI